MKHEPPPKSLSAESKKFWNKTVKEFDLVSSGELQILAEICASIDA